jgi:hypothetical protein
VKVYSNGESVELFVNGVSQGRVETGGRLFVWSGVALLPGVNEIRASATRGGIVYEDVCSWNYAGVSISRHNSTLMNSFKVLK